MIYYFLSVLLRNTGTIAPESVFVIYLFNIFTFSDTSFVDNF